MPTHKTSTNTSRPSNCKFNSVVQLLAHRLILLYRYSRGWRWHKVHCFWLTKDIEMQPLSISPEAERGYYVIWNTKEWVRERVSLTRYTLT